MFVYFNAVIYTKLNMMNLYVEFEYDEACSERCLRRGCYSQKFMVIIHFSVFESEKLYGVCEPVDEFLVC